MDSVVDFFGALLFWGVIGGIAFVWMLIEFSKLLSRREKPIQGKNYNDV